MLILTVCFERKCDFAEFVIRRKISEISGMSERNSGGKSVLEIFSETDIRGLLSELLAEYILGPFRKAIALSCIASECPFISEEEKNSVINELPCRERESDVKTEIYKFIKDNAYIDIAGFVRFRMPGFFRNVMADTSGACDRFMKKREYEEMVALLRHHVKCSASSGVTDITFQEDGGFAIVYPDGRRVEIPGSDGSALDSVLGMLMVTVPEKLKIYNRRFAKEGILEAIEGVFGESVEYF